MREFRLYGSVRGAFSNERPYREPASRRQAADDLINGETPCVAVEDGRNNEAISIERSK